MIHVIKAGLETSIQDWPGRIGFANQGFPVSGPFDSWSFRLANLLVGNILGAAGLECQFLGPTLEFTRETVIAVTGADMQAMIAGKPIPLWESIAVKPGQQLVMGGSRMGARAYIAVAGGIASESWLGSRSTFHKAGVGGIGGHALTDGLDVPVGEGRGKPGLRVKAAARPPISTSRRHSIEVVAGPNDDWIDEAGHQRFLSADWKLTGRSDRTGYRLEGPEFTFTEKAYNKPAAHGLEPANIIDQGYPIGAVNLAGQTPIILVADGPSMGGFINPYTVPQAAFWKLAQALPGDILNFVKVSVDEAQAMARSLSQICTPASLEPAA
jgi:5-oxoprolinase (ATP-hydrolysing) subunit C